MRTQLIGLLTSILLLGISFGLAHSGRTDANGGHNDRKNGGYHYHGTPPTKTPPSEGYGPSTAPKPIAIPQQVAPIRPVAVPSEAQKAETEAKVIAWQMKQAEGGFPSAQFDLGLRYLTGNGVEKDVDKAISFLRKAALQGNTQAQKKLDAVLFEQKVGSVETQKEPVSGDLDLRKENDLLRKENQDLRRLLTSQGTLSQQVPNISRIPLAAGSEEKSAVSPVSSPSKGSSWTLSSTGKRHNNRCRYFGSGKPCGQNDGVECKVCGG